MFFQDGLTGSAWGDWANYTGSLVGPLRSTAGITYKAEGTVFADDAIRMYPGEATWALDRKVRNTLMHSLNGNGACNCLFFLTWLMTCFLNGYLYCEAISPVFSSGDEVISLNYMTGQNVWLLFSSICSLMCLFRLGSSAFCKRSRRPKAAFKVGNRQYRCRRSSRFRHSPHQVAKLRTCAILVWFLFTNPGLIPFRTLDRRGLPRKIRNRLMRCKYGNTVGEKNERTKWETSADCRGLELLHVDELSLPPNQAAIVLKACDVKHGAVGIAFANSTFLESKLHVRGGKFLVLIVPGRMTSSLQNMLRAARLDLPAHCFETILSLYDPGKNTHFPRQCTLINLGEEDVKPAVLEPMVTTFKDETTVMIAHCYFNKAPEEWNDACSNPRQAKQFVATKTAAVLKLKPENLESWGFVFNTEPDPRLRVCIRVPTAKTSMLMDLKDPLIFFRPMLNPGEEPPQEAGVSVLWSKFSTIAALAEICNTLPGIRGYTANTQSLGVRVETQRLALAIMTIINDHNKAVAGKLTFALQGLPVGTSAQAVTEMMATTRDENKWKPWKVIPTKHIPAAQSCTWHCKADEPPPADRVILQDGHKLIISQLPSKFQIWKQKNEERQAKAERAKEDRRQRIVSEQDTVPDNVPDDPWQQWKPTTGKGKGKGKDFSKKKPQSTARPSGPVSNDAMQIVAQLQQDVEKLNRRANAQDDRLRNIEQTITSQYSEIMSALRGFGAPAKPAGSRKREAELGTSPLKAITEAGDTKAQRSAPNRSTQ